LCVSDCGYEYNVVAVAVGSRVQGYVDKEEKVKGKEEREVDGRL
jgi:hypothetical protein